MKILFINPAINVETNEIWATALKLDVLEGMSFIPRLAPMILAALTPKEHSFAFWDEDLEVIDIHTVDADVIALTGMTVQAKRAYYLAKKFKSQGRLVIMGGIHASSCPEEVALHVDAVCTGEAENYWLEVLEDAQWGKLKKFYHSKDYPPVMEQPIPRFELVNHDSYSVFPIQATRGCPHRCDFCCIKVSSGNKYRKKPVSQVVAEIQELEKHNNGYFKKRYHFMDDNLYVDRAYTIELFKALIPLNITWMGMGSLQIALDEEILDLIGESGCHALGIGFESISEESLKEARANKKNTIPIEDYKVVAQNLIQRGIIPIGFFIFGFEQDQVNTFKRTTDFIIESRIIIAYFSILTPFPKTVLYERMKDKIMDHNWSHYGSLRCVYQPAKLTKKELESGTYQATLDVARLDRVKDHLRYFWSYGPWKRNPVLTFRERLLLVALALKMRKKKEFCKFLIWAAFRHNATDVYQIIASGVYYNETLRFRDLL